MIAALVGAAAAEPKRAVPDYDGRGNPESDRESWVTWIPRVILSPFYAVSEYAIRRPLGSAVSRAERDHWADTVESLFTFGAHDSQVIYPTALFDLGLLPSVGVYYAGDDVIAAGNTLRGHVATWGKPWIVTTVADRYHLDAADSIQARFEFRRAEDNLFLGIGPDVTTATRSRYGLERFEGSASYRRRFARDSYLDLHAGVRRTGFVDGTCCGDPRLVDRVAEGTLMLPAGYGETYTTAFGLLDLQLDSRGPRPEPGNGVYLHLYGRPNLELHDHRSWAQYGGDVGGAVDLTGHRRIITMSLALGFADRLSGLAPPFTELATLGGEMMPGFVPGWMTGDSTAAAQLAYTWPVWIGIDGQTRFTLGNAFGEHLDGLGLGKLRMSWDIGLITSSLRDQGLELLFGLGSETIDQGAGVTSVRIAVGSRQGF